MSLRISFDLSEKDLKHFKTIMQQAEKNVRTLSDADIIGAAEALLVEVQNADVPDFISERLTKLKVMTSMLTDSEWQLPDEETHRVLSALAYFGEAEDLIPDHIPGLGFLDDAIMVELVVRELKHEIEAYEDFSSYRSREEAKRSSDDEVTREEWLAGRRAELHSRMRRRRRGSISGSRRRKSPFSIF
ncbi:MAG: YkvA family protein [Pseudomonadota bacterium]